MTALVSVARPGLQVEARLRVEQVAGRTRIATLRSQPPLTFRPTPQGVVWVGTAAGPLGGDDLHLEIDLGPGAPLRLTSSGAALVLPGPHGLPSSMHTRVRLGERASLRWAPEPMIVAAGADHRADTVIELGTGADLVWVDEVVLGRHGEGPGRLRSRLRIESDGRPVLCTGVDLGRPGWDGPAGVGDARAVAQVVLAGAPAHRLAAGGGCVVGADCVVGGGDAASDRGARLAVSPLPGEAMLINVAGPSVLAVRRAVAGVVATVSGPG